MSFDTEESRIEHFLNAALGASSDRIDFALLDGVSAESLNRFVGQLSEAVGAPHAPTPLSTADALHSIGTLLDTFYCRSMVCDRQEVVINSSAPGADPIDNSGLYLHGRARHLYPNLKGWVAISHFSARILGPTKGSNERGRFLLTKAVEEESLQYRTQHLDATKADIHHHISSTYAHVTYPRGRLIHIHISPKAQKDMIELATTYQLIKNKSLARDIAAPPLSKRTEYNQIAERTGWKPLTEWAANAFNTSTGGTIVGIANSFLDRRAEELVSEKAEEVSHDSAEQWVQDNYMWSSVIGKKRRILSPQAQQETESYVRDYIREHHPLLSKQVLDRSTETNGRA